MGKLTYYFKVLCLAIFHVVRHIISIPRSIQDSAQRKRQREEAEEHEADRLDRLRNPSNYQGR